MLLSAAHACASGGAAELREQQAASRRFAMPLREARCDARPCGRCRYDAEVRAAAAASAAAAAVDAAMRPFFARAPRDMLTRFYRLPTPHDAILPGRRLCYAAMRY